MPNVLIISQSNIKTDSRVVRQLEWLISEGWTVDTLGLGPKPLDSTRTHFEMTEAPSWTVPKLIKGLIHTLLPYRARFRLLSQSRLSPHAAKLIRDSEYDLVLFNDLFLTPWVGDRTVFDPKDGATHLHLDIHEYHPANLARGKSGALLANGYHKWVRRFIGSSAFSSRTVVGKAYAEVYSSEFQIPTPGIVRNAAPLIEQKPRPVHTKQIRLLYHGGADWQRGFHELIEATPLLDERFSLTFMLTGSERIISEVKNLCKGLENRIHFVPRVPVTEVTRAINEYDLELMFFPPVTENRRLALPNKLFEAVQGRIGLVIGESPSMMEMVKEYANGIVVKGWTGQDLAAALNELTAPQIMAFKQASHEAAPELSAEHEARSFFAAIGMSSS